MTAADLWAALPLLLLVAGALAVLLAGALRPGGQGIPLGISTLAAAAVSSAILPAAATGTTAISVAPISRFFMLFFSLAGLLVLTLSGDYNRRKGIGGEEYTATILFAVFSMSVLASSTNLLTAFLGLEGMTFSFYFLVATDRNDPDSGEAGLKYLLPGATSAAITAFGIALLYAGSGTLALHRVAAAIGAAAGNPLVTVGVGFILGGLAFKISLVPAHLWTPDVYQGAPTPVAALLSTASKAAAVLFLLLLLPLEGLSGPLHSSLRVLSVLSMVVGNLAALRQRNLKRMLAYSSVGQMGYVTLALLSAGTGGYAAALYYLVAYAAMNIAAFGAIAAMTAGEEATDAEQFRGAGYGNPFSGAVLALALFGLAGIPPTGGFMGKFFIFAAALRSGETAAAVIGILAAAVSVYFYLRVVVILYMHAPESPRHAATLPEKTALACAAAVILLLGILPSPLIEFVTAFLR